MLSAAFWGAAPYKRNKLIEGGAPQSRLFQLVY